MSSATGKWPPGWPTRWLRTARSQVILDEAVGAATGLAALGERIYDAILVGHAPGELDAIEFVEGLRRRS